MATAPPHPDRPSQDMAEQVTPAPASQGDGLEAALSAVRALHPAWPATLVREVAERMSGTLPTGTRHGDGAKPPAALLAALASPAVAQGMRAPSSASAGDGDGP